VQTNEHVGSPGSFSGDNGVAEQAFLSRSGNFSV
jgi:hypothetical protein